MALSYSNLTSGGAASNDFTINIGSSGYSNITLDTAFPAGKYVVTSSLSDSSLDIYLQASDGTNAGYINTSTSTSTITATKTFNTVVVYGATTNDTLTFQFKYVFAPSSVTTNYGAAPKISSVSISSLPNINDTTVISGENFGPNISVSFTGSGYSATAAKNIVRTSSTSLIVTRPDNFPPSASPYTITVTNPGIANPTSTNSHILSNAVTAGAAPSWTTSASLPNFIVNQSYSQSIVATDSDGGSSITYSYVSGSLPSGITFNTATGVFSGTPTTNASRPYTYTVRATDSGGNYVDRSFTMTQVVPDTPLSISATDVGTNRAFNDGAASISFTPASTGPSATSYTATAYLNGSATAFSTTGSSSPLVITGLSSNTSYTFVIKATNASGDSLTSSQTGSVLITTVPQAPTIGTVTTTNSTTVSIPFTANATGGKSISSYTTTSSPSLSLLTTGTTTPLSATGSFLLSQSYTFQIYAVNANGTSAASTVSNSLVVAIPSYGATPTTFNSSTTYTVPSGKNLISGFIYSAGGGGSAGSGGNNNQGGSGGAGGGSGTVLAFKDYPVTPGQTYTITIGAGGSGGTGGAGMDQSGNPGNSGSATSLGNIFIANGGGGASNNFTNGSTVGAAGSYSSNANSYVASSSSRSGGNGAYWGTSTSGASGGAGSTNTGLSINLYNLGAVNSLVSGSGGGGGGGAYLSSTGGAGTGGSGGAGGTNAGNGGTGGGFTSSNNPPIGINSVAGNSGSSVGSGGGGGGGAFFKRNVEQGGGASGGAGSSGRIVIYEA